MRCNVDGGGTASTGNGAGGSGGCRGGIGSGCGCGDSHSRGAVCDAIEVFGGSAAILRTRIWAKRASMLSVARSRFALSE